MRFTAFILVFVVCFSAINASSEMRLIEGYVFDHKTQRTIGDVDIKVNDGAEGTTTDERGRFVLRLPQGVYRLSFFRVGYGLVSREIRVSDEKLPILYIEMVAREIVADTIEVVAQSAETRFEELYEATGVLSGDELQKKYSLTLAETMKNEIGVAIRSMGPAPARPVIRGLSGDRVQINIDGMETRDLSATSADHAVTLEPFNSERLEIIRGPRTLLHTASAIGGVINVVKQKIPEYHPQRVSGSVGAYGETVNRGYLSAAGITVPVGPLALYAETTYRNTRDVQTPIGRLVNTPIDTRTHTLGLSYPTDRGYIGASFDQFDTQYGIPGGFIGGHPNGVDLDIDRRIFDGRAAFHFDHQVFSSVEMDFTRTFYHHFEYESSGSIGSEFLFHDYRGDLKLLMNTQGQTRNTVLSLGFGHHNLKLGGFVFTPPTREQCASLGLYHEFIYRDIEFQAAARYTYADFDPRPTTRSLAALRVGRTFHAWSAAISPLVNITDQLTGGFNFSRSQRVPTIEELYNDGPHLAAYTFEVGNIDLGAETSLGFEVFFHYLQPGFDFVLSGYWNEFDTYIAPRNTGEINFAQLLPIYAADGVAARFLGLEMHLGWRLNTRLDLELNGSYVRGENRDEQLPLPEMPPLKFVGSTTYEHPYLTVGGTAEFVAGQERVDIFEDPTDGYAVFGVYAQRDMNTNHTRHSIILSVDNLLDTEYRNHLSRIRSVMPETGRSVKVHYKVFFF
ncbi:MAG: TonB-dependent receptor [Gemmatimonadota bacterium]|nr:TonB-dependent receptor [Gemmatimonadota bacterium]